MIDTIKKILDKMACMHTWNCYIRIEIYNNPKEEKKIGTEEVLICVKCGKIKKIKY